MEDWATVALVLGSNAIMGGVNWLVTKRQIKHSEHQLEKQLEAEGEGDKHNRMWEVRSEPMLKLRGEIARMAQKLETLVGYASQVKVVDGVPVESDVMFKAAEKALEDWIEYIECGEFYRVEHMQYEHELKAEAHRILGDYHSAYSGVMAFWNGESTEKEIDEAKDAITRNAKRVSAIQLRINGLLEGL